MIRVMLVEDDPSMRRLLQTLLELEGFEVVAPQIIDRSRVLDTLQNEQPDTLLMDVHLPNSNGIDLLKEIRLNPNHSSLRILMTSGEDFRQVCMQSGADGFLLKPYMPDDLIRWLREKNN